MSLEGVVEQRHLSVPTKAWMIFQHAWDTHNDPHGREVIEF